MKMFLAVYQKVVFWKNNIFLLPSAKFGKWYIEETTRLINYWIPDSSLQDAVFKATMFMSNLLLKKPTHNLKVRRPFRSLEKKIEI